MSIERIKCELQKAVGRWSRESVLDEAVKRIFEAEEALDRLDFQRCPQCGRWNDATEAIAMLGGHYCQSCGGDAM